MIIHTSFKWDVWIDFPTAHATHATRPTTVHTPRALPRTRTPRSLPRYTHHAPYHTYATHATRPTTYMYTPHALNHAYHSRAICARTLHAHHAHAVYVFTLIDGTPTPFLILLIYMYLLYIVCMDSCVHIHGWNV